MRQILYFKRQTNQNDYPLLHLKSLYKLLDNRLCIDIQSNDYLVAFYLIHEKYSPKIETNPILSRSLNE